MDLKWQPNARASESFLEEMDRVMPSLIAPDLIWRLIGSRLTFLLPQKFEIDRRGDEFCHQGDEAAMRVAGL